MERLVRPEWLDELPADSPDAMRSRRDLRRINAWMSNAAILARTLRQAFPEYPPRRIIEIGAGDGTFFLRVTQRLGARTVAKLSPFVVPRSSLNLTADLRSALLVDRRRALSAQTVERFRECNWTVRAVEADVFDFLGNGIEPADAIVANLFLHHFSEAQLKRMFQSIHDKARVLIAVEPRRSSLALCASRLLWLIGCNAVTRHDAPISVRAGFAGRELSKLWPDHDRWRVTECSGGLFSHLFIAHKQTET